MYFINKT